jgi:hypothetical protein
VSHRLTLLGSLADRGLRWLNGGLRWLNSLRPLGLVVALAADRAAELADPFAERFAQLRQAFGAEDDQGDDQDGDRIRFGLTCNWRGGLPGNRVFSALYVKVRME